MAELGPGAREALGSTSTTTKKKALFVFEMSPVHPRSFREVNGEVLQANTLLSIGAYDNAQIFFFLKNKVSLR